VAYSNHPGTKEEKRTSPPKFEPHGTPSMQKQPRA
jgi:hypothetical protein